MEQSRRLLGRERFKSIFGDAGEDPEHLMDRETFLREQKKASYKVGVASRREAPLEDLDRARKLLDERLEVNRKCNNAEKIAETLWGLAQLDLAQQKIDDAMPRLVESYDIFLRLGRANDSAVVGVPIGRILAARDRRGEALTVLLRSAYLFSKLGLVQKVREVEDQIKLLKLK
jgi:hypothetical protein